MCKVLEDNQAQLQATDKHLTHTDHTLSTKASGHQVKACLLKQDFEHFRKENEEILSKKASLAVADCLLLHTQVSNPFYFPLITAIVTCAVYVVWRW
jgi:hypothetical protein